jgi:hypothetical protein
MVTSGHVAEFPSFVPFHSCLRQRCGARGAVRNFDWIAVVGITFLVAEEVNSYVTTLT